MALVAFKKRLEQEPIDLNVAYIPPPDTCVTREVMEAVRTITSTGPTGQIDLRNRPERAVLTPRNLNQVRHTKGAEIAEHSNRRPGLLQSQFETTTRTILSQSPHHPKLAVTFKFPQSESCSLLPGTCVNYMPRRSITSRGYVKAHGVEALSLLADVSCEVKRTHIQRSCNVSPRLSESKGYVNARTVQALSLLADVSCEVMKRTHNQRSRNLTSKLSGNGTYKERSNQMPLQKKMASVLKNLNQVKEHCTDKHSQLKITDSYGVVRKLRTPRRPSLPAFRCPTKLQKNISLSKCDEILSRTRGSNASLADTAHLRDGQVVTNTSAITSADIDMPGEGKFPDDKSMPNIGSVPLAAQRTSTTLERVSKSSCQISGTKKRPSGGSKRAERFTNQILQFIGETTVSEKLVRQTLGNNPDTSKALRLLLTERKVQRLGPGGRGRAYEYVATEKGLLHIHGVKQATSEVVVLTPESVSSCNPISGAPIVSDAPRSEAQCLPTQNTSSPEASVSDTNGSRPYSVTPHCCLQWPLTQTLNCVLSSQSLDLPSSGITECR